MGRRPRSRREKQTARWRFERGLPRGGLGQLGWVPTMISLGMAWLAPAVWAMWVCMPSLLLCIWCALGLRADKTVDEGSDYYEDVESIDWKEAISGNYVFPMRRHSTMMVVLSVLCLAVALARWYFGWGPFV